MQYMKLYEHSLPDRKIWWTQRNRRGNCFEIEQRGLFTKIYIDRMNGRQESICDTFSEAEKALKDLERRF